jgi:hypothetical protein
MSNFNNAFSSVTGVVGKCVGNNRLPRGTLPIVPVPAATVLPVVVAVGLAAYAARSLVSRLFD